MSEKTHYLPGVKPLVLMSLMAIIALASHFIGQRRANAEAERLEVLWPNLVDLHQQEKNVLLQASARCRLIRLPMPVPPEAVAECLQRGVIRENREVMQSLLKRARSKSTG